MMLTVIWFWAMTAAAFVPTPAQIASAPMQVLEAQRAALEAVSRPIMTLGWVEEDDAPIF